MQIAKGYFIRPQAALRVLLVGVVTCIAGNVPAQDGMAESGNMQACLQQAASTLPAVARSALDRIDAAPRQLLALRSYLRVQHLERRWSWTEAEVDDYRGSPEQLQAQEALARVQSHFSALNPGYTLYVNTRVRSLDTQLARWNSNASVGAAADALADDAEAACKRDASGFAGWLKQWHPPVPARLAAPGLSAHGQARAFDFQVKQGESIIAGTDSHSIGTVWEADGWARRLAQAVHEAGPAFGGPLCSPREPWHYTFDPAVVPKQADDQQVQGWDKTTRPPAATDIGDVCGNDNDNDNENDKKRQR